ncbi:hypothetical protein [Arthrobacter sp. D2-10]
MIDDVGGTLGKDEGAPTDDAITDTPTSEPKLVVLPDTADTRLLVDLTSHANDLSEAAHSLGIALDSGEGSELWEPLTSHAVTAYIRPFILSNVRRRLDEMPGFPGLPPELMSTHEMIRKYRNAKVAHSQSDLVMPLPVAFLGDKGEVRRVWGMTLTHQMPLVIADRFAHLLERMGGIVDELMQPVNDRLLSWARSQSPESVCDWKGPEIRASIDADFNAARERKRTPRFTAYWSISPVDDPDHDVIPDL